MVLKSVEAVADSQWYILGERLKTFESEYAAFNQVKHCIGVSNGLDAIHLGLRALGIGKGDEVILSAHSYIACLLGISMTGARPVLVEPNEQTFNLDPARIESAITSRTKAILPVHLYGQPCEMDQIMAIAGRNSLFVVEDNAQAHGAAFREKPTGSWGQINATSFYPTKTWVLWETAAPSLRMTML